MKTRILFLIGILLTPFSPTARSAQSSSADETVYMFTSFHGNGQDGLRFLYSGDGYHWTNVPGTYMKPDVGSKILRDPSIVRGPDGVFHLVWTTAWRGDRGFGYASSTNLIHWSEQKFIGAMEHEPATVNVWAPELFYDDGSWRGSRGNEAQTEIGNQQSAIANESEPPQAGCYVIVWASTIPGRFPDHLEPPTNNHRMYYTTTKDFKKFAPTKLFLDPDFSVIDCHIVKDEGRYVLLLKDNTRPQRDLRVAFGETPLGPWKNISPPFTQKFTEGPCALRIGDDWLIYFDAYQENIYGAVKTRDFKTFTNITGEVSFPEHHKHGTAFKVPRAVLDMLLQYATKEAGVP
jgi:hypothetical protein